MPPVSRYTLGAVHTIRFELPVQNNVDQNPASAGMDPQKRAPVSDMERRGVLLQLTPVKRRNLIEEGTVNARRNGIAINAFSCSTCHSASIRRRLVSEPSPGPGLVGISRKAPRAPLVTIKELTG